MKESHIEGLANHNGPESGVGSRKAVSEAMTGESTGGVLSPENKINSGMPMLLSETEGNIVMDDKGECMTNPAGSETSGMYGNSMCENRESLCSSLKDGNKECAGKNNLQKPAIDGHRRSDSSILPTKSPNKVPKQGAAEAAEGRGLTKGRAGQQNIQRTQSRANEMSNALSRIRQAARRNKGERFTALLHHMTLERLRAAFLGIKRNAAAGVDGVTWDGYEKDLEKNLQDLHTRIHRGAYRAKPSRRGYIPKSDGKQRPLGIATLEDKLVQRAVTDILNAIYEEDFLGYSYGFRPGRKAHEALDALTIGIHKKKVNWVLDADIRGYFQSINHEWLMKFVEYRISDKRILRLIRKWLKCGVIEEGKYTATEEGTPQGSSISPLLSNIYLHYVLDRWVQEWRKIKTKGDIIIVRWADDFVMGFQYRNDAEKFLKELQGRLKKYSLELHPEKTRLIRFGKYASENSKQEDGRTKPETFNFLGFTHYCGKRRNGEFIVKRKTMRKRLTEKLHEVKVELRKRMHHAISQQGSWLQSVVRGYFNYHAIPNNGQAIVRFRYYVTKLWYWTLRRRSQRNRMTWERMGQIVAQWLPPPRILHPWPEQRFAAMTQGKSRMR